MTDVLITAGELAEFLKKEPCVIIDTRNPEAYGAGHLPGAVNVHEIFTYLATSTPEGMHGAEDEIRRRVRRRRTLGQGNRGHLRTVDEFRLRPVLPRLLSADHARLSQDQGAAWRLRRLGGGGPAGDQGRAVAGEGVVLDRAGSRRHPDRRQDHARRRRQARHRAARRPRHRRVDRRKLFALRQGFLPAQGTHPRRGLAGMVPHDEADRRGAALQVQERNFGGMRHRRHHARARRSISTASRARAPRTRSWR